MDQFTFLGMKLYRNTGFYSVALLLLAVIAFWEPYFSHVFGGNYKAITSNYKHFHVVMAVSWLAMLMVQPYLIRTGKRSLHRQIGKLSFVLGPLMVLSIVLLAHSQMVTFEEQLNPRRHFILFIQLGFAIIFAVLYGLAMVYRRTPPIHARYMILTGILLIEPVLVRVFKFNLSFIEWSVPYQVVTWPMVDLLLLAIVIAERGQKSGRRVFQGALVVFVAYQALHFTVTDTTWWIRFAGWFANLPIT